MQMGLLHKEAPELRVTHWIDGTGNEVEPLVLADLGDGFKILYCFQHWCPGCHSSGFPTLKRLVEELPDRGFGFAAVQTVFEGAEINTVDKLRLNQDKYGLEIPFGHDVRQAGETYSTLMGDYRTSGTPWFTVIDPEGVVVYADFHLDPMKFVEAASQANVVLRKSG